MPKKWWRGEGGRELKGVVALIRGEGGGGVEGVRGEGEKSFINCVKKKSWEKELCEDPQNAKRLPL